MGISLGLRGKLRLLILFAITFVFTNFTQAAPSSCKNLLRLQTLNTFNLVLSGQRDTRFYGSGKKPKKNWQLAGMAEAVHRFSPNVLVLQEVENESQTMHWNRNFLGDSYEYLGTEAEDDRGVRTAFLVSEEQFKDYDFEVESHADETWNDPSLDYAEAKLFKRDLPVLWATYKNGDRKGKRAYATIGVHLKSKRSRKRDFESRQLREAQVIRLLEIASKIRAEHGEDFPIMIAGDFNDNLLGHAEAGMILSRGYVDSVLALLENASLEDTTTFTYMNGRVVQHQKMDGILMPASQIHRIKYSRVMTYLDETQWPIGLPRTFGQKAQMPSDHNSVSAIIDIH